LVFSDVEALKAAVKDLQKRGVVCSLVEKAVPRMYYAGQLPAADYVLKLDQANYDVGFFYDKAKKGLIAKTDFFAGSVQNVLGAPTKAGESQAQANMGKLYHAYARAAATRQAIKQGYTVRTVDKPDGSCQLIMTGMVGA
jgi:hypothetical protein